MNIKEMKLFCFRISCKLIKNLVKIYFVVNLVIFFNYFRNVFNFRVIIGGKIVLVVF